MAGHPMKRIEDKKKLQYLNYGVIFFLVGEGDLNELEKRKFPQDKHKIRAVSTNLDIQNNRFIHNGETMRFQWPIVYPLLSFQVNSRCWFIP